MAFPIATGTPSLSAAKYLPTIYANALLIEFYAATVFGAIANTDYEGEVQNYGESVEIRELPEIAINNYVAGQDLVYEKPAPTSIQLALDKGKYWGIQTNDVEKLQSDIEYVGKWAKHAAENMKIAIDSDILAAVYADAAVGNSGVTAGVISASVDLGSSGDPHIATAANIVDYIIGCGQVLDEQNCPENDRAIVLPSWAISHILSSDLQQAYLTGDETSILRNGIVGQIDRFTVYRSNQLANSSTNYNIIACQKTALTFASQMIKTETLKAPNDFGDLVRSLQVFGYKVVKPEAMVHGVITPS